jgi:hypothetical protein
MRELATAPGIVVDGVARDRDGDAVMFNRAPRWRPVLPMTILNDAGARERKRGSWRRRSDDRIRRLTRASVL